MNVFDYIKAEETSYQTQRVRITDNWDWNMQEHVEHSTNMLNSQFWKGKNNDFDRPYMQIVLEPVNLQKALLDFDVKDVNIFATAPEHYGKSFVMRKFHEWWARKEMLGQFFNDIVDSFTDYGGTLVKKTKKNGKMVLEVVPLQRIAFCDQTDIMGGPICEKHQFSPDQLRDYENIWNNIDEVIALSSAFKTDDNGTDQNQTPGHYIDVYELHGMLPQSFHDENGDIDKFDRWMYVVTYYQDENGDKQGILLFDGPEDESLYDFCSRDPIYGRALGRGAIEELFHPQIWSNWNAAQMKAILEMAGKMIFQTADQNFKATNVIKQMQTGQVIKYADGKPLVQLNNQPGNLAAFENSFALWEDRAKRISASYDTVTGADTTSGMPFQLGALLSQQGHTTHEQRREMLELFMRRLYHNWILPYLAKEMQQGQTIRAVLTKEELERVLDTASKYRAADSAKQQILQGNLLSPIQLQDLQQQHREAIAPQEGALAIKIPKGFFNGVDADVEMTITGENKNLPLIVNKLSSVFMTVAQNPAILQDSTLRNIFNQILEYAGLSPVDFADTPQQPAQPAQPTQPPPGIPAQSISSLAA